MTGEKLDRRIRRTRRMLKQGLAELMREKDFQNITVKDITERCDFNRCTFYLHYTDTYDLLEKLENDTLHDFQAMINANHSQRNSSSLQPAITSVIDYLIENADICKVLFENKASSEFVKKFQDLICLNGAVIIREWLPNATDETLNYCFSYITSGMIGMVRHWFDTGMALERQEIIDRIERLIKASAMALLT